MKLIEKITIRIIASLIFTIGAQAQNLYGGIEIGSKGVKMSILDIKNAKKGLFESKASWTENTTIAKGISKNGKLDPADIDITCQVVVKNYKKMIEEYKVDKKQLYIIASSGVGMAENSNELVQKIKDVLDYDLEIISVEREARLLIAGGVPANRYTNSLMIDIGGGNTKGGYIDVKNEDSFVFFPISMRLGTVTLTEKVKLYTKSEDFADFLEWSTVYKEMLQEEVGRMYRKRASAQTKKNIYFSGGAVWAFKTLFDTNPIENYSEFTKKDVTDYHIKLIFEFSNYVELAKTNVDIAKVLKTYDQQSLLSANNLLISLLDHLENQDSKKYYFIKNGQMAWLVAYVLENAKNGRVIY